jgi:hypothetical protein
MTSGGHGRARAPSMMGCNTIVNGEVCVEASNAAEG